MTDLRTPPIPEFSGLVDETMADKPGRYKAATITLEVWIDESDEFEVHAETTQLHSSWDGSYRKTLAEMAEAAFKDFLDEEFSE